MMSTEEEEELQTMMVMMMMMKTTTRDGEEERRGEKTTKQRNKNENESGVCARFLYNALSVSPSTLPTFHGIFIPGERAPHPCVGWIERRLNFHG
jgi:hypothetical protein